MKYRGSANRSKASKKPRAIATAMPRPRARPTAIPMPSPMPSPTPSVMESPRPRPSPTPNPTTDPIGFMGMKKGGKVKKDRRDGIALRGKTRA